MSVLPVGRILPNGSGKCPSCGEWNTYVEEVMIKESPAKRIIPGLTESSKVRPVLLRDITSKEESRINLMDEELNRVLGGGLVKGSLVLIGGEPGIGKSTLVLQTVLGLTGLKTLYVSGEESSISLSCAPTGYNIRIRIVLSFAKPISNKYLFRQVPFNPIW